MIVWECVDSVTPPSNGRTLRSCILLYPIIVYITRVTFIYNNVVVVRIVILDVHPRLLCSSLLLLLLPNGVHSSSPSIPSLSWSCCWVVVHSVVVVIQLLLLWSNNSSSPPPQKNGPLLHLHSSSLGHHRGHWWAASRGATSHSVLPCPLAGQLIVLFPVRLVYPRDLRHQRIIRVWITEQRANW